MTTNVTVFAVDGPVVVYLQDGSSSSMTAQETKQFQLIEGGFCTISDAPAEIEGEGGEHPPPGYAFAHAMVEFWQGMVKQIQTQPTATPL